MEQTSKNFSHPRTTTAQKKRSHRKSESSILGGRQFKLAMCHHCFFFRVPKRGGPSVPVCIRFRFTRKKSESGGLKQMFLSRIPMVPMKSTTPKPALLKQYLTLLVDVKQPKSNRSPLSKCQHWRSTPLVFFQARLCCMSFFWEPRSKNWSYNPYK